jgi:hypothetical protein
VVGRGAWRQTLAATRRRAGQLGGLDPARRLALPGASAWNAETPMRREGLLPAALATLLALSPARAVTPPAAQEGRAQSWSEVKCERYRKAWTEALARRGTQGLGPDFIARHEAFLATGCTAKADVCPRSAEELDLANVLTILAMNAGTASTFLPFACRR